MSEPKTFPTAVVASAVTGIAMAEGMTYSDMQQVYDAILGRPVWTHELAHEATVRDVRGRAYDLFPDLPTKAEASADYVAALQKAEAAYGSTMTIPAFDGTRTTDPVSTLREMVGDKPIAVVSSEHKQKEA